MSSDHIIIIPLTQGQWTTISIDDGDLAQYKWNAHAHPKGGYYATTNLIVDGKYKHVKMHRLILSRMLAKPLERGEECDHQDTNKLNNCRDNLRLATRQQNVQNRKKPKNNTTGFKGVYWYKAKSKWQAQITIDGRLTHLGLFDTAEDAHTAYCEAAVKYHGEFARFD